VALTDRMADAFGLFTTMARAGIIVPLRPLPSGARIGQASSTRSAC
jgi:hypothetical protein